MSRKGENIYERKDGRRGLSRLNSKDIIRLNRKLLE